MRKTQALRGRRPPRPTSWIRAWSSWKIGKKMVRWHHRLGWL